MPQKRFKSPQTRLMAKAWKIAKEAQKEAVEAEKTSKQAQTDAETALKNAENANQATQAQIKNTQAEITTKTQAVSDAKAHRTQAEQALKAVTAEVNALIESSKPLAKGSIQFKEAFVSKIKEKIQLNKDYWAIPDNKLTQADIDKFEARNKELKKEITDMVGDSIQSKNLVLSEADKADKTQYDVNNLPKEVRDDLTLFAADLTNQMRRQLDLSDVKVTEDSFHFADKIAREYEKDGVTPELLDSYRAKKNGHGHYAIGINKVAKEYGLNDGQSDKQRQEAELRGGQSYENSVNFVANSSDGSKELVYLTKAELRAKVFESLVSFVSTEKDYGHAKDTLGFEKVAGTLYYGGFGASQVPGMFTVHTVPGIPDTYMKNSTFNRTEITNPYTVARKGASTNTKLEAKKAEKAQAEETLKTANQTVAEAETALQTTNSNLKDQEAQLKDTVALKQTLQSATTTHNQAVVALSNANALVATLSATKADKEAKLAELKATAKQAEKEFNQAKAETKAEKATLYSLQAKAEEATQAVSVAKEALNQAKAQVVSSKELVQDLKVAVKELEARKAELKDAEEALKEAKTNQATAQEALEAKEKVAKEAHKAYATAKASYEAEQARLQAEELKKHPVTEKGIPEVRPALPEFVLPTTPSVPSVPVASVSPVVPTTPRVEVPVVNNNGGVAGQDKAKVDVVAKQKTETKNTKDSQAGNWIESAGRWWYQHEDGSYTSNGWEQIKGTWYYFDNTGWMQTGWVKTGGTWYYLNETGSLATGWVKDNGTWYYLKENGKMATGWVKDNDTWYYLDSAGAMKTGWFTVSGKWYYAYSSGALAVNTTTPDGYTVNANGEWV